MGVLDGLAAPLPTPPTRRDRRGYRSRCRQASRRRHRRRPGRSAWVRVQSGRQPAGVSCEGLRLSATSETTSSGAAGRVQPATERATAPAAMTIRVRIPRSRTAIRDARAGLACSGALRRLLRASTAARQGSAAWRQRVVRRPPFHRSRRGAWSRVRQGQASPT